MMNARFFSVVFSTLVVTGTSWLGAAEVTMDFATDPHWEGYRNRLLPVPMPITRQDFGWHATQRAGGKAPGEIGGWIQRSITPASFAKVIPTRTLKDRLSASGKFTVSRDQGGSGILLGWFHESSRGWRTPNSLAFRIDGNGGKYWVFYEYGTRGWLTGGGGCFEGDRYQTTATKPFKSDGTVHTWTLTYDPDGGEGYGMMTFLLDGKSYPQALAPGHKMDGAEFNRFGIFNQQLTGDGMEAYFSDLVVDGETIDLSKDPGWIGVGNKTEYADRKRRPFQDFGWSEASRDNEKSGEIGGMIWRDVKPSYYAAKTEPLSLDDELFASGTITFRGAGSDSGAYFGWFDAETKKDPAVKELDPAKNILAIFVEGPSRIGHYFRPEVHAANGEGVSAEAGPIIRPDGRVHRWELRYSPSGASGIGEVTVKFDDRVQSIALKPEHRKLGAKFDRFGIFNCQTGGHYVDIALDDLRFTKGR